MEGVSLYRLLEECLRRFDEDVTEESTPEGSEHAVFPHRKTEDEKPLWISVKETLIYGTVHERLSRALGQWKPGLDSQHELSNPLHLWILPWFPYLDQPALLPSLVSDCKRKLRSALGFLQKTLESDEQFFPCLYQHVGSLAACSQARYDSEDDLVTHISTGPCTLPIGSQRRLYKQWHGLDSVECGVSNALVESFVGHGVSQLGGR